MNPAGLAYAAWLTLMSLIELLLPLEAPTAPPEAPPAIERPAAEIMAP